MRVRWLRFCPAARCRPYHGIDLSAPALELAAKNLASAPFEVELDHEDFVEARTKRPEPADAAWCSLSIHHLPTEQKRRLLESIRAAAPLVRRTSGNSSNPEMHGRTGNTELNADFCRLISAAPSIAKPHPFGVRIS
jgi:hypothetical protein